MRVSEIDLSSPLNYGTPSPGSSIRYKSSIDCFVRSLGFSRTPRTGSRGTPIRVRSDIQTDRRVRQEFAPGAAGDVGGVPSSEVFQSL